MSPSHRSIPRRTETTGPHPHRPRIALVKALVHGWRVGSECDNLPEKRKVGGSIPPLPIPDDQANGLVIGCFWVGCRLTASNRDRPRMTPICRRSLRVRCSAILKPGVALSAWEAHQSVPRRWCACLICAPVLTRLTAVDRGEWPPNGPDQVTSSRRCPRGEARGHGRWASSWSSRPLAERLTEGLTEGD